VKPLPATPFGESSKNSEVILKISNRSGKTSPMIIANPKMGANCPYRLELCQLTPTAKQGHGNSRSQD
jgi:hypothetical protein